MRCTPLVAALLALGACSKPSPQSSAIDLAVDAYVKGDVATVDALAAKAEVAAEAAKTVADYDSACTKEATDARRAVALARQLRGLDASPVFSMTEEARFVYMSADLTEARRYLANGGARVGCQKSDPAVYGADVDERQGWVSRYSDRVRKWQNELRQKSPSDFHDRLRTASSLLEANNMGRFVEVSE